MASAKGRELAPLQADEAATQAVPAFSGASLAPALGQARSALQALQRRLEDLPAILRELDAVAAKTKLLGFNASILAAQAGSEGRSFAVVAEQMKALNQRADLTTQRLHVLAESLRRSAQHADRSIDAARDRVEQSGPTKSSGSTAFGSWVEATRREAEAAAAAEAEAAAVAETAGRAGHGDGPATTAVAPAPTAPTVTAKDTALLPADVAATDKTSP